MQSIPTIHAAIPLILSLAAAGPAAAQIATDGSVGAQVSLPGNDWNLQDDGVHLGLTLQLP